MEVMVIAGNCLTVNSSANLCHIAYLKGLTEIGAHVTLLSADGRDYIIDNAITIPSDVECYYIYAMSLYERLSLMKKKKAETAIECNNRNNIQTSSKSSGFGTKIKRKILSLYGPHGIEATFGRKALHFKSDVNYDFILSISHPPVSHLVAYKLLKQNHIRTRHWIQIWEDPWHSDVYGFNGAEKIRKEEQRLLSFAEKICYVSPLTLANQQHLFPESAHKMFWQPLPFYYKSEDIKSETFPKNRYGYFGDYTPTARNLAPFYEAAVETGIEVNICGNPDNLFSSTADVHIHPRLKLDELKPIEDNTNVLIFLCNRKGGQIPGKIYQYSATAKTILFIIDGIEEEQKVLREYFGKFNRYVFCQNNKEDIVRAIRRIESGELGAIRNIPIDDFAPKTTISNILKAGS